MITGRRTTRTGAARGAALTARAWATEAPLRMLMNNLDPEVAERPDDLVVYGGTGRAARDWRPSTPWSAPYHPARGRRDHAGAVRPAGRRDAHPRVGARVIIANSNLVPDWANWPEFRRLEKLGLTMYGQMTAGSWIYIGTQGIVQGTVRDLRGGRGEAVRRHPGRDAHPDRRLRRHGRRPTAGGHPERRRLPDRRRRPGRLDRRVQHRYLDEIADDLDQAVGDGVAGQGRTPGLVHRGSRQLRRGVPRAVAPRACRSTSSPTRPARTTRCPTCRRASRSRTGPTTPSRSPRSSPTGLGRRWPGTSRPWWSSPTAGAEVFDYGNSIRDEARRAAYERAFEFPGFVPAYIRPLFCEGKGPFRWVALSGDPADIDATDRAVMDLFPDHDRLQKWLRGAGRRSPSRACPRGSAGLATANGTRPDWPSTTWWPAERCRADRHRS